MRFDLFHTLSSNPNVIEVKIPTVGESISEVQIGQWLKQEGDWVAKNEDLVEIETEKASVLISAPTAGYLRKILIQSDAFATIGDLVAEIEPSEAGASTQDASPPKEDTKESDPTVMPAANRLLREHKIAVEQVQGTGPGGRVLKEDVLSYLEQKSSTKEVSEAKPDERVPPQPESRRPVAEASLMTSDAGRHEEIKPMSMLRRTIAARLVQAQQTAALLTTFNEVNMQPVMELRNKYRDAFQDHHGVKLGFMSFFAKAAVEALRRFPAVNSEIRGDKIVLRHYFDIGIAIGGGKGLVVPVLRNVEQMSFATVEKSIADFAEQARLNKLQPTDLQGGTFTISNGGIYGSLLSTPIVNPPQSGILGLHSIQQRPIAENGQVVIRPMMFLALTYDHRVVDGREAVSFLKTVKDVVEDPSRLFLEV